MGQAILPECTVNMLALGKEPWRFKDLEDQLNMRRRKWQVDQQKQIIANISGKMHKIMKETIIIQMVVTVAVVRAIMAEEVAEDV
jgi:hypothetical protein